MTIAPCNEVDRRWDLWEDGLSSSLISLWLQCREQFRLGVVHGWSNPVLPHGILFGGCVHYCLEQAYCHIAPPSPNDWARWVSDYRERWFEVQGKRESLKRQKEAEGLFLLARWVLTCYAARYAGDWQGLTYPVLTPKPRPAEWLSVEGCFSVYWRYPDGKAVRIRGTRDLLFRSETGELWIGDTKCYSRIDETNLLTGLSLDLQQNLYLYAALQNYPEEQIGGAMLNVIRRPQHKQRAEEGAGAFKKRLMQEISKSPNHFFKRLPLRTTDHHIAQWARKQLAPVLIDIRAWWEGKAPHYMNPQALTSKYGRCQLWNALTANDFAGLFQKPYGTLMDYQESIL